MDKKTLTIVLCQTRESEFTFSSLVEKVLTPMQSDLAFCGSAEISASDPILTNAKYIWNFPEPEDWGVACDSISTKGSNWRELCKFGDAFLGGAGYENTVGSGLIIMYWREILRRNIRADIRTKYDWFIITRSDFKWIIKHPDWNQLDPNKIYFLDGEKYGGVSDRHIIFHSNFADKIFSIADFIFHNSNELSRYLESESFSELNPEQYLALSLKLAGLAPNIEFIPYLGYSIRHASTKTRWSTGEYSKLHKYFIKYPAELRSCNFYRIVIIGKRDWEQILAKELGMIIKVRIAIAHLVDYLNQQQKRIYRGFKKVVYFG